MKILNFRNTSTLFLLILSLFTACRIFVCPCGTCFLSSLCSMPWLFYTLLISVYLLVSVSMAFFPSSGFHYGNVLSSGNTEKKNLTLTFDDGPEAATTPGILEILKKFKIRAAFFVIGKKIAGNEDLLKKLDSDGHIIGNHSWAHSNLWDFNSSVRIADDLERNIMEVERVTGKRMKLFRPPYGVINPMVAKAIDNTEVTVVAWSLRSFDTTAVNPVTLLDKIVKNAKPGDILLFHDSCALTAGILEKIIVSLQERGYVFIPLDEMLNLQAYETH
ncbi:MAG: polysaccharide deacetylase family protein [Bacteroidetes bacterium]|nr:polysaccharide deacetylase family protein [Bacteroidota bacterium]